jgi:glycosyltransferase involved in cell wall biosynthesis
MTSVSAVIPVHNGAEFVGEAVRSVLVQTHPVLECIVVDDGSSDATGDVLAAFGDKVRVIRQSQSGVSSARNRGAGEARGELVAFLDHDDAWLPEKLERQLAALGAGDTMVVCALQVVDAGGTPQQVWRLGPTDERLVRGMLLFDGTPTLSCSSSGVVRRERFLEMGGFDPVLSMSADWDLMLRTVLEGGLAYVDEPLVRYRIHGANMSRHVDVMERDMGQAFAKAFAHPRLDPALRARRGEAYGRLYRMLAGSYRDAGKRRSAAAAALKGLRHHPALLRDLLTSSYSAR